MQGIMMSLPVRNLKVSQAFFTELGFTFSPDLPGPDSACLVIGGNVRILLLAEDRFRDRINGDARQTRPAGEILICLLASSEREVDEIVTRAVVAGGKPWPVVEERPVYSGSFQDPDGYLWQVASPRQPAHQEPAGSQRELPQREAGAGPGSQRSFRAGAVRGLINPEPGARDWSAR